MDVGSSIYTQPVGLLPWTVVGIEAADGNEADVVGALRYFSDPLSNCVITSASVSRFMVTTSYGPAHLRFWRAELLVRHLRQLHGRRSGLASCQSIGHDRQRLRQRRPRSHSSAGVVVCRTSCAPGGHLLDRRSPAETHNALGLGPDLGVAALRRERRSGRKQYRHRARVSARFSTDEQTPALATSANIYFGSPMTYSLADGYRFRGASYADIDAVLDAAMPTVAASLSVRFAAPRCHA